MEISPEYFHDIHPFNRGSSFILEGVRNEMFVSVSSSEKKLVTHLFQKVLEDTAYHYRYVLHENPDLRVTVKGIPEANKEISEVDVREHDLFRGKTDPFQSIDDSCLLETSMAVYQDAAGFYRVYFQNSKTKKWEGVEFVERRKNGNSLLKCHEASASLLEGMRLIDTLTFRSVHLRANAEHSSICMALYPTCTVDILRRGRVMGRDLSLRAPRAEALAYFVKHEVWYHSYTINSLLGVQYNKQNHGVLRENNLQYTMEHLQQAHEREFYKAEKNVVAAAAKPSSGLVLSGGEEEAALLDATPHPVREEAPTTAIPVEEVTMLPPIDGKRKNFTPSTKMEILYRQECRDSVLDFVLKDTVLLMEYDHINGKASLNSTENCQALSVITHALKTRRPEVVERLQNDHGFKIEFLVDLLNCITRSKHFIEAWVAGEIEVRDRQQPLTAIQGGLFARRED